MHFDDIDTFILQSVGNLIRDIDDTSRINSISYTGQPAIQRRPIGILFCFEQFDIGTAQWSHDCLFHIPGDIIQTRFTATIILALTWIWLRQCDRRQSISAPRTASRTSRTPSRARPASIAAYIVISVVTCQCWSRVWFYRVVSIDFDICSMPNIQLRNSVGCNNVGLCLTRDLNAECYRLGKIL